VGVVMTGQMLLGVSQTGALLSLTKPFPSSPICVFVLLEAESPQTGNHSCLFVSLQTRMIPQASCGMNMSGSQTAPKDQRDCDVEIQPRNSPVSTALACIA